MTDYPEPSWPDPTDDENTADDGISSLYDD